jgi:hypothetical protein
LVEDMYTDGQQYKTDTLIMHRATIFMYSGYTIHEDKRLLVFC